MANKDYNKEDGVWRTIGGRRVFIKNGQSLADAMKESGKFKNKNASQITLTHEEYLQSLKDDATTKTELDEIDKEINKAKKDYDLSYYDENGEKKTVKFSKLKEKANKDWQENEEKLKSMVDKEKYMSIPEEERVKAFEEGKNWKDLVRENDNAKAYSKSEAKAMGVTEADLELSRKLKKEAEWEKNIDEMYNKYHGKTDKEIAESIAKERGERILTDEEQKQREVEFMKNLEKSSKEEAEEMINSKRRLEKDISNYYQTAGVDTGLTEKARQKIISGYDNYDDAISNFAEEHDIPRYRAEEYFEKARKKLGVTVSGLKGEKEGATSKAINDKIREQARKSQNDLLRKVASSGPDVEEEMKYADDRATFRKISKTYGYDNLSDTEIKEVLDFAEKRGLYHSKEEIATMRRYLDNRVLRNEFDTYKKEHPNSKISFTEWKQSKK